LFTWRVGVLTPAIMERELADASSSPGSAGGVSVTFVDIL